MRYAWTVCFVAITLCGCEDPPSDSGNDLNREEDTADTILKNIPDSEFVRRVSGEDMVLTWADAFELDGQRHRILVFSSRVFSWPGSQPVAMVIVDSDDTPVCWKLTGGQHVFTAAHLRWKDKHYIVTTFSASRFGGTQIDTYSIATDEIVHIASEHDKYLSTGFPMRTFDPTD